MPEPGAGMTRQVAFPAGMDLLLSNDRLHWAVRAARTKQLRKAGFAVARQQRLPRLGRVKIVAEWQPPDRRRRDAAAIAPTVKALVDGIVDAGVLADDCGTLLTEEIYRIGPVYPAGRVVLFIEEVP